MKILGLILELNPPHYGHLSFIKKAVDEAKADLVIAVITASFTMRGEIAVTDKFSRTSFLLEHGIDLIAELPYIGGCAGADYFGKNAVDILNRFGITDLAFGVELDDRRQLETLRFLTSRSVYREQLQEMLGKGYSYNTACNKALQTVTNDTDLITNFSLPNNTLALRYLNTVSEIMEKEKKTIDVHLIKRIGNAWDEETKDREKENISAAAIRRLMRDGKEFRDYTASSDLPYADLNKAEERLLTIIKARFLENDDKTNYLGVKEGIENRIERLLPEARSYEDLIAGAVTKRYPVNYLRRVLLNIVLRIPKQSQIISYLRVLGFNAAGEKYLRSLDGKTKSEIITSFKNVSETYSVYELKATKLAGILTGNDKLYLREYEIPLKKGKKYAKRNDNSRNKNGDSRCN